MRPCGLCYVSDERQHLPSLLIITRVLGDSTQKRARDIHYDLALGQVATPRRGNAEYQPHPSPCLLVATVQATCQGSTSAVVHGFPHLRSERAEETLHDARCAVIYREGSGEGPTGHTDLVRRAVGSLNVDPPCHSDVQRRACTARPVPLSHLPTERGQPACCVSERLGHTRTVPLCVWSVGQSSLFLALFRPKPAKQHCKSATHRKAYSRVGTTCPDVRDTRRASSSLQRHGVIQKSYRVVCDRTFGPHTVI